MAEEQTIPVSIPNAKRNPGATRQRILDAARQLLAEGDGDLEMARVAQAAGVSQGLAYHHYGSKEGLLNAVVNDFYDRMETASLMARLEHIDDWDDRECERVRRYLDFLLQDPLGVIVTTRLARTPAVAAVDAQRWDKLVTVGARNMAEGQAGGAVKNDTESELLTAMVLGAARAAAARAIASGNVARRKRLAEQIWRFARHGLQIRERNG